MIKKFIVWYLNRHNNLIYYKGTVIRRFTKKYYDRLMELSVRRHGKWEYFFDIEEMARCSNCYEVIKKERASCYCPHCGAKMEME